MAVGMVVDQAVAQPDDPRRAQIAHQPFFDLLLVEAGIAVRVEQALFGGDEDARPVTVDRSALQDPVGGSARQAGILAKTRTDRVIAGQLIFAAPAVEPEIDAAPLLARTDDDRCGVADPDVAERLDDHVAAAAERGADDVFAGRLRELEDDERAALEVDAQGQAAAGDDGGQPGADDRHRQHDRVPPPADEVDVGLRQNLHDDFMLRRSDAEPGLAGRPSGENQLEDGA